MAGPYDSLLHREVAVKELRLPDGLSKAERAALLDRAMTEACAAGRLDHPNFVAGHDVVLDQDYPWIVMSLVDGPSLHILVQEHGRLSTHRTAQLGADLLAALRSAHQAGILHRDLKPQHVLVDPDGRPEQPRVH